MEPDAVEIRVLGCLVEKQKTTPDAYPLSLNALRLACNQSTNRDPVVQYDEGMIRDALAHSYRRGWTRLTSGHGSRAAKYRHLLDEALHVSSPELALLAVLMLRGAQTPGELKQRSDRLHRFADLAEVQTTLDALIERRLVARLARRPGQKEERYAQLLGGDQDEADARPVATAAGGVAVARGVVAAASGGASASRTAAGGGATVGTVAGGGATTGGDSAAAGFSQQAAAVAAPSTSPPPPPARAPSIPVPDAAARLVRLEREVADLRVGGDRIARLERDVAELRGGGDRIAALERELGELRTELAGLREALGE